MKRPHRNRFSVNILAGLLIAVSAHATIRTWDGGGDGTTWTDTANWNPDGTTTTADNLTVGTGFSVTNGQNTFATLDIQSGASVTLAADLASGRTLSVTGTLNKANGVLRLNGAIVNLSGHLASTINFLDTNAGTINFTDGATFDNAGMNFEHKGNNTFGFKLSASGFKTLTAGSLLSGNNGSFSAAWSNVTYNVDISDYDLRSGLSIVLMDFSVTSAIFDQAFNPTINIIAGASGLTANLSFNTSTDQLVLSFPYPLTWSGDNGQNWLDKLNWIPTNLPTASDTVLIKSGGVVTNAQNTFASIYIQTNATVKVGGDSFGGNGRTISVAGTLDKDKASVLRLSNGGTLNLSGSLGSNITWLDTQGSAINFTNGAAFMNANMSFQHRYNNTFGYKLSETGFTTLVAGKLWTGDAHESWSNVTFNIDITGYTGVRATNIVLADFNGHSAEYNGTFDPALNSPKVNIIGHDGGSLRFDTATSKLILRVYGPKGTFIRFY